MSIVSNSNLERYVGKQKEWAENRYDLTTNCNYQLTEKASEVSFYPTGNSPLDCTVDFMFTETPPASGEKSPDNPSTITGVNSLTVTRGHVRGILENSYTVDLDGIYYGGSVDLTTGLMTVTWVGVVYDGTENITKQTDLQDGTPQYNLPVPSYSATGSEFRAVSTHFPFGYTANCGYVRTSGGRGFRVYPVGYDTLESFTAWVASQYARWNSIDCCIQNSSTFTVQLTPQQILSLSQLDKYTPRLNTVYSTGTLVQVGYRKSPIREEYEIQQAIASLGGI